MNIISIDASTKSSGIAYYENEKLITYDCFTASSTDLVKRIYKMSNSLNDFMKDKKVDKIILEEVIPKGLKDEQQKNIQTMKALMYLQAQINFMVHDNYPKVKIEYIYPSEWRAALGIKTGRGIQRESLKKADIEYVKNNFGIEVNDDIADAICIGYAYTSVIDNEINWE